MPTANSSEVSTFLQRQLIKSTCSLDEDYSDNREWYMSRKDCLLQIMYQGTGPFELVLILRHAPTPWDSRLIRLLNFIVGKVVNMSFSVLYSILPFKQLPRTSLYTSMKYHHVITNPRQSNLFS